MIRFGIQTLDKFWRDAEISIGLALLKLNANAIFKDQKVRKEKCPKF